MKLTKKQIKKDYEIVIQIHNESMPNIFNKLYDYKIGHTERPEGWGLDVYDINGKVAICQGYDTIIPYKKIANYDLCKYYNKIAKNKDELQVLAILRRFIFAYINQPKMKYGKISNSTFNKYIKKYKIVCIDNSKKIDTLKGLKSVCWALNQYGVFKKIYYDIENDMYYYSKSRSIIEMLPL